MNAIYQFQMNPIMWGMARMSRKIKSFRLAPHVAAAVERAAMDLGKSEGEIIDYCVARSISGVVEQEIKENSVLVDEGALKAFKAALRAFKAVHNAPGYKKRNAKPRNSGRSK